MVMAIIPAPISVSVVRWAVGAVTVTATVVMLLMEVSGHIDTDHRSKQSGKETGLFRRRTVIARRYVGFHQRLVCYRFTQIFRKRKMLLPA